MSKIIGLKIKKFRQEKGISREDLSNTLDISIHTLAKYEQGQREPNIETLHKIANALNTNVYNLIDNNTTLTSKLIKLFEETVCKNSKDAKNTLELICELIDIDEEIINTAMNNEEDISESYLICMVDKIFEDNPGTFEKFYKENKYFISSEYDMVDKKCSELELEYAQYISFLSRLSVINPSDKCISNLYQKALNNTLTGEDIENIKNYKELQSNLICESPEEHKEAIRKANEHNNKNTAKFNNIFIQNGLIYNLILSILKAQNYDGKIDNTVKKLNLDTMNQLAIVILENTKNYLISTINTNLKDLTETHQDLIFAKKALNEEIKNYNSYLSADIKSMTMIESPEK